MSVALADGLRRRGVDGLEANLAAETGAAVYRVAFERWVDVTEERELRDVVRASLVRLRTLTAQG
jgi:hypothetical protein